MKVALSECIRELRVPDSKMARSYARIIAALLSATGNINESVSLPELR
jgi:hypothetical protein